MPADPIVSDHYGDVLWMNGKKIDQILKKKGVGSILQEFLPVSPSTSSPQQPITKPSPQRKHKTKQNY